MTVGELRDLLGNYHDSALVVVVTGLDTTDIEHVQVSPRWMSERNSRLHEAIEIHVGGVTYD